MGSKFKAVAFKVGESPIVVELSNGLKNLQEFVKGYIQVVPLGNNLYLVCNEEGSFGQFEFQEKYRLYGDFFIGKETDSKFISLTEEEVEYVKRNIQTLLCKVLRY